MFGCIRPQKDKRNIFPSSWLLRITTVCPTDHGDVLWGRQTQSFINAGPLRISRRFSDSVSHRNFGSCIYNIVCLRNYWAKEWSKSSTYWLGGSLWPWRYSTGGNSKDSSCPPNCGLARRKRWAFRSVHIASRVYSSGSSGNNRTNSSRWNTESSALGSLESSW